MFRASELEGPAMVILRPLEGQTPLPPWRPGDQQFWFAALRAANVSFDAHVAEIKGWRHGKFEHTKRDHFCELSRVDIKAARNLSDPCAVKHQNDRGKWVDSAECWRSRLGDKYDEMLQQRLGHSGRGSRS
jgi:hypothetical protein